MQCQSKIFLPDDAKQRPQFSECPRPAPAARKMPGKSQTLKLCAKGAKMWDEQDEKPKAAGAA